MDVHDVALTHWCHIESCLIALIVFIEIDDGDDLLCRQVVDIRLIRDIEGTDLRRRCAMYHKALLEVTQVIIGGFIDDYTLGNIPFKSIIRTGDRRIIYLDGFGSDRHALTLFINCIIVTTIVIGLGVINIIGLLGLCLLELNHIDINLFY